MKKNNYKTYVILPDLHVEVDPPHKVCVRDIVSHNPYREKVRYFKTAQNAARKLREELAEEISSQSEWKYLNEADLGYEVDEDYIAYDIAEELSELEEGAS